MASTNQPVHDRADPRSSVTPPVRKEGFVSFLKYQTWYTTYGDILNSQYPPLVVLHGGPSGGHDYLRNLTRLTDVAGIPVVLYDQVGCGRSTHLPDMTSDEFTVQFFLDELNNLLAKLDIHSYYLLGHSWGGMLASEHAARQPVGLRRLILHSCPASLPLGEQVRIACYKALPDPAYESILQHEKDGKKTEAYELAMTLFRKTNLCRIDPIPADLMATLKNMQTDPTVSHAMLGTSDLYTKGTLEGWSIVERLSSIKVQALALYGKYDYAGGGAATPYREGDWNAKVVRFEHSSHVSHLEETDAFMEVVTEFLKK